MLCASRVGSPISYLSRLGPPISYLGRLGSPILCLGRVGPLILRRGRVGSQAAARGEEHCGRKNLARRSANRDTVIRKYSCHICTGYITFLLGTRARTLGEPGASFGRTCLVGTLRLRFDRRLNESSLKFRKLHFASNEDPDFPDFQGKFDKRRCVSRRRSAELRNNSAPTLESRASGEIIIKFRNIPFPRERPNRIWQRLAGITFTTTSCTRDSRHKRDSHNLRGAAASSSIVLLV